MERELFLEILKDSFSAYYDIFPAEIDTLPLSFRGDYRKREERYWLTKSIPIWGNETGEFAYVFSAESFDPSLAEACIDWELEDGLFTNMCSSHRHHKRTPSLQPHSAARRITPVSQRLSQATTMTSHSPPTR